METTLLSHMNETEEYRLYAQGIESTLLAAEL
jgi:hypothetical protein